MHRLLHLLGLISLWLMAMPCSGFVTGPGPLLRGRVSQGVAGRMSYSQRRQSLKHQLRLDPAIKMTVTADDIIKSLCPAKPEELRELLKPSECPSVHGLRVVIIGPPCSGKSLIAPMIEAKYGIERISVYDLVGEEVVDDDSLMELAVTKMCSKERLGKGFVLHGYPATLEQAKQMNNKGFEVDIVIELLRNDDEADEWRSGRLVDTDTGLVYHSTLLAAPSDAEDRLVVKPSNTVPAFQHAKMLYRKQVVPLRQYFADTLVQVDASLDRGMVEVITDVCEAIDKVCPVPDLSADTAGGMEAQEAAAEVMRFMKGAGKGIKAGGLLSHVMGLNTYTVADFIPFYVEEDQVGWVRKQFATQLDAAQRETKAKAFSFQWPVCDIDGNLQAGSLMLHDSLAGASVEEKSEQVHSVIKHMWETGMIRGWRGEFQSVAEKFQSGEVLQIERGAVAYFGVPSSGGHVTVFSVGGDGEIKLWVARRSKDKPTYPGLLDQCVAGGQPAGLSLQENVEKECIEEANISAELASTARPVSVVKYMYETRKGMSPKTLYCYDLEVPEDFVPENTDGEVEDFARVGLQEVVESMSQHPEGWKPNSALVCLDFAIRKGAIDPDVEPDFVELVTMLRGDRKRA